MWELRRSCSHYKGKGIEGIGLIPTLADRDSCAGGSGDKFSLLIGYCHLGYANSSATPYDAALGSEFIIHLSPTDEVNVELGG